MTSGVTREASGGPPLVTPSSGGDTRLKLNIFVAEFGKNTGYLDKRRRKVGVELRGHDS